MLTTYIKKLSRSFTPYVFYVEAGVDQVSMLKVYTNSVRYLLEYAVPVWQSNSGYLSSKFESIQKRALKIIFPCPGSYSDALELARVKTLAYRRDKTCKEYMYKMKDLNHALHPLLPTRLDNTCPYTIWHKSDQLYLCRNVTTCRTKCTEDFSLLSILKYF